MLKSRRSSMLEMPSRLAIMRHDLMTNWRTGRLKDSVVLPVKIGKFLRHNLRHLGMELIPVSGRVLAQSSAASSVHCRASEAVQTVLAPILPETPIVETPSRRQRLGSLVSRSFRSIEMPGHMFNKVYNPPSIASRGVW